MTTAHTAREVAEFFLSLVEPEEGDTLSNLKLQKLCYYAQGFSLALLGRPIFREDIQAWEHGPVVPFLYHFYKDHGNNDIQRRVGFDPQIFTEDERMLLEEVWNVYGQYSAWKLRNMTPAEPPWASTPRGGVISHDALREYFRTQVRPAA